MHKSLTRLAVLTVPLLLLSSCGGQGSAPTTDTDNEAGASSGEAQAAIQARIDEYFQAETPEDVCGSITLGMQAFLKDRSQPTGDPDAPADEGCVRVVERSVERGHFLLAETEVEIEKVLVEGERGAARVRVPTQSDKPYAILLVRSGEDWLIHAEGQAPPGFQDLFTDVLATQ